MTFYYYSDEYPNDVTVKSLCPANVRTNELRETECEPPSIGRPLRLALHKRMIIIQ